MKRGEQKIIPNKNIFIAQVLWYIRIVIDNYYVQYFALESRLFFLCKKPTDTIPKRKHKERTDRDSKETPKRPCPRICPRIAIKVQERYQETT